MGRKVKGWESRAGQMVIRQNWYPVPVPFKGLYTVNLGDFHSLYRCSCILFYFVQKIKLFSPLTLTKIIIFLIFSLNLKKVFIVVLTPDKVVTDKLVGLKCQC